MLLVIAYYVMNRRSGSEVLVMDFTAENNESEVLEGAAELVLEEVIVVHVSGNVNSPRNI